MALTTMELYDYIKTSGYQAQSRYYLVEAATDVLAEDPGTAYHAERVAFAGSVLFGTAPFYEVSLAAATNATIRTKMLAEQDYDGDMLFVMGSIYNHFALNVP